MSSRSIQCKGLLANLGKKSLYCGITRDCVLPYASNYYSLSGVDIKNFGIPLFSIEEQKELLSITKQELIDKWLKKFYN